jgi:hypothetical protein
MQPAFYDDAFRSYFPGPRQAVLHQAAPVVAPPPTPPPPPPPSPTTAEASVQAMHEAFSKLQHRLLVDLNDWKRSATTMLAEVASSATQQPPPQPQPAMPVPTPMAMPMYVAPQPPMAMQMQPMVASYPPPQPCKTSWCSNVSTAIVAGVVILFFVIVLVLLLVYVAKLSASVNGLAVWMSEKSRRLE